MCNTLNTVNYRAIYRISTVFLYFQNLTMQAQQHKDHQDCDTGEDWVTVALDYGSLRIGLW